MSPVADRSDHEPKPLGKNARATKRMLLDKNPWDWATPARQWAEDTLRAANLPAQPHIYTPGPNGGLVPARCNLTLEEQDAILAAGGRCVNTLTEALGTCGGVPWAAPLVRALELMGYTSGTQEWAAAEALTQLARVGEAIEAGEPGAAAFAAYWVGRLHERHLPASPRVRRGGRKAAVKRADHEEHVQMLLLERTLAQEAPEIGQNARAEVIAERLLHQQLAREHPMLSEAARADLVRRRSKRKYEQVRKYLSRNVWSKRPR
jgi:hypothetical protein